ncbi:TylF/MycF/NovP-related O-methyltransferase [Chloroflexota bacterium]
MLKPFIQKIFNATGYEIRRKSPHYDRIYWPGQSLTAQTFFEIDEGFHNLYDTAQVKTQMTKTDNPLRRQRHYTLNQLLWCADIENGDVSDIGCWRGLSTYQIANYIKQKHLHTLLYVFDSFEGLSNIGSIDTTTGRIQDEERLREQFACPQEIVERNLSGFDFIKYYKGWIPDRFHEVKGKSFSFVHIDVDLYQPTYDSFQFFYPRLIKHGIMVFDDYGCTQFPGAKQAIDKCLKMINNPPFILLPSGQAFLIKDFIED